MSNPNTLSHNSHIISENGSDKIFRGVFDKNIQTKKSSITTKTPYPNIFWLDPKKADKSSLSWWIFNYYVAKVENSAQKTVISKVSDLKKFRDFFIDTIGSDQISFWTSSITKYFQNQLIHSMSNETGRKYKATTVNRIIATIRHFGRWVHNQFPLTAGDPMDGVKDITVNIPEWNGISDRQLALLRAACDQRLKICNKKYSNPHLEVAVFSLLLWTGLREFELVSLDCWQYKVKHFLQVKRKGKMVNDEVYVPIEARKTLDIYLEKRLDNKTAHAPLLLGRSCTRLSTRGLAKICQRLSNQASTHLKEEEKFLLTPHMLRHTFLKKYTKKYGLEAAYAVSGHVSKGHIYRYAAPTKEEREREAEGLF